MNNNNIYNGVVIRSGSGNCHVYSEGREYYCLIRKKVLNSIREDDIFRIVPGDKVIFIKTGSDQGCIEHVLHRENSLRRQSPGGRPDIKVIAANSSFCLILVCSNNGRFPIRFIDRINQMAVNGGMKPVICITKSDLLSESELSGLKNAMTTYTSVGTSLFFISGTSGDGVTELREFLGSRTSVLIGHSGVGKSTLVGALSEGEHNPGTTSVREKDGRGRHTTSDGRLYICRNGLRLIDTPGIKEAAPDESVPMDFNEGFPEFSAFKSDCRFSNCSHLEEPGCAVRDAVRIGAIPRHRYESYRKLVEKTDRSDVVEDFRNPLPGAVDMSPAEAGFFTCTHCGKPVPVAADGTRHRNHCPHCLWSLHLDHNPGDRAAYCSGDMEPVSVWLRGKEWTLIHRCRKCGTLHSNRIAGDDNEALLLSLAMKPLSLTPFSIANIGEKRPTA